MSGPKRKPLKETQSEFDAASHSASAPKPASERPGTAPFPFGPKAEAPFPAPAPQPAPKPAVSVPPSPKPDDVGTAPAIPVSVASVPAPVPAPAASRRSSPPASVDSSVAHELTEAVSPRQSAVPGSIAPPGAPSDSEVEHLANLSKVIDAVSTIVKAVRSRKRTYNDPEVQKLLDHARAVYEKERAAIPHEALRLPAFGANESQPLTFEQRRALYAAKLYKAVEELDEAGSSGKPSFKERLKELFRNPFSWAVGCVAAFGAVMHFTGSFQALAAEADKFLQLGKETTKYLLIDLYASALGLGLFLSEFLHRRRLREAEAYRKAFAVAAQNKEAQRSEAIKKLSQVWDNKKSLYDNIPDLRRLLYRDEELFEFIDVLSAGGDPKILKGLGYEAGLPRQMVEYLPMLYQAREASLFKTWLKPLLEEGDQGRRNRMLLARLDTDARFRRKFQELIERKDGAYRYFDKRANFVESMKDEGFGEELVDRFLLELEIGYNTKNS